MREQLLTSWIACCLWGSETEQSKRTMGLIDFLRLFENPSTNSEMSQSGRLNSSFARLLFKLIGSTINESIPYSPPSENVSLNHLPPIFHRFQIRPVKYSRLSYPPDELWPAWWSRNWTGYFEHCWSRAISFSDSSFCPFTSTAMLTRSITHQVHFSNVDRLIEIVLSSMHSMSWSFSLLTKWIGWNWIEGTHTEWNWRKVLR